MPSVFGGRLFGPSDTFPLTPESEPERALVEALAERGEHLHTQFVLGGYCCDILIPFRGIVLEHDGTWAHREGLQLERRQNAAWEARGMRVFRVREKVLPPTGAIDVFLLKAFRRGRTNVLGNMIAEYLRTERTFGMG